MSYAQLAVPTGHDLPVTSLAGLLGNAARRRPDAVAVICGDQVLTTRMLVDASLELASYLRGLGAGTDDRIGLFVEPSLDLMVGVWGVLHAGAAYLPLSPEYPEDRLRHMVQDSGTRIVVTQPHLTRRLAGLVPAGTRIVTVADAKGATGADSSDLTANSLAYVIYTSGSTGKPKGVMIEHRSVLSQLRWLRNCGHLGLGARVLQKTPMSFDAAQWEILAPAVGATVVMGEPGIYRDPEALVDAVVAHRVTTLQCVPTLLQALLDTEGWRNCTSLREVFSGGEALSRQLARAFSASLPQARLVNLYGPTECTINATAFRIDPDAIPDGAGTIPIGVPVDNTPCYILDESCAPVDIGEVGELYIGGVQLARGYLNRPDLTSDRFVQSPFVPTERLYRTGDLAHWHPDGTIQFVGRVDNQVKLRGYRVELDEIALAIEEHAWVRRASAIVVDDPRTGQPSLVACVELNPHEAALMDQGNTGAHHRSKAGKTQVKAQLANTGLRPATELLPLPGRQETERTRREVFARKTYRFYDGGTVSADDIRALLASRPIGEISRQPGELTPDELGALLRWFGQFHSEERLLPKYSYASPGALYATQMYLETSGIAGLDAGVYYYHPVEHALARVGDAATDAPLHVHFLGKLSAIEPVYKNNIREVLELETGHMVGVFEQVLPAYGLSITPFGFHEEARSRLGVAAEDLYLGTFEIHARDGRPPRDTTEIFVQAHRVEGLPSGQYRWHGELEWISDLRIERRHVVAINQQVYDRAAFGITAVSRADEEWLHYVDLGTKLHDLQRNGLSIGFMSSGYSSKTGCTLPSARRIDEILASCGIEAGPSYFALGGRISDEQIRGEDMREDVVHMNGPAEIIRDELGKLLPDYMIPNRVLVLDRLPLTASGKVDGRALSECDEVRSADRSVDRVAPSTPDEHWLAEAWGKALKYDDVSVEDDFFGSGGNSLTAVALVNRINRELGVKLPLQVVFTSPTLADLARQIEKARSGTATPVSRLVPLADGNGSPVFCWPGLGGYPMNLRPLAGEMRLARPMFGVQAHGINAGETPYATIREMAVADVAEIRRVQPHGPYTLWGYSFGARVAFETAWQLEQLGEKVEQLLLICPGNPHVEGAEQHGRTACFANPAYVTILFSVFAGAITGPELARCLRVVTDEESFVSFVHGLLPDLDPGLVRRVTRIVGETYEFEYSFRELAERRVGAPVTIFKADGDDYSFVEESSGYSAAPPAVVVLRGDHYAVLKSPGELVAAIQGAQKG